MTVLWNEQNNEFFSNITAKQLYEDRYKKGDETPEQTIARVAEFLGKNDNERNSFEEMMLNGYAFPAGRTMSNAAIGKHLTLNNCFVPYQVPNDMGEIYECVKIGALTHKAGGGTGYDFSLLSPKGTPTNNDAVASGVVSFMHSFDAETATISQGNRRGANMGVLNIYHPDIMDFIFAKQNDSSVLKHFNMSIMVDDDFMKAVQNNTTIHLHYPVYNEQGQIDNNPDNWTHDITVYAPDIWEKIMQSAYNTGEPGIQFYNNMNNDNNIWYAENIVCTNPCSEYLAGTIYGNGRDPKQYGGACNLGSILLHNFVKYPFSVDAKFDLDEFKHTVHLMVTMLDNTIDVNKFPVNIYENYQKEFRTIGLGVTGLADCIVMLGMKYNSFQALKFADFIMETLAYEAYSTSIELAKTRGPFPGLSKDEFVLSGFLTKHAYGNNALNHVYNDKSEYDWIQIIHDIKQYGIRNAKLISIAPCGTFSLVWGNNCSSGIEPIFSLEYNRKIMMGGQETENEVTITMRDYAYDIALKNNINPDQFITSQELTVDEHIDMLATIARHVDMSVSKTINVPTDYPYEDACNIYKRCWESGIKGCTIFRPNEIRKGILSTEDSNNDVIPHVSSILKRGYILEPSDDLIGQKRKIITGCGKFHLGLYFDEITGEPFETFINKGDGGGCERNLEFISKLMSKSLRGGVPIEEIIDCAKSVGYCKSFGKNPKASRGTSCPTAIGFALEDLYNKIQERCFTNDDEDMEFEKICDEVFIEFDTNDNSIKCPDCGEPLRLEGGCNICMNCGYSSCG